MSRTDLFARYSQIYAKAEARQIVPEGMFVRQLIDIPRQGLDVGVFFKPKRSSRRVQLFLGNPIPVEVSKEGGFVETDESTYLSRDILSKFKTLDFLRVVIAAGTLLKTKQERLAFLKRSQRILDVVVRKAKNVLYTSDFEPFRFDKRVRTLREFLEKDLKMDEISVEAAAIPFNMARPEYVLVGGNQMIVIGNQPNVPLGEFFLVGGIGYEFDKKEGALSEERLFRSTVDLSAHGIDDAYVDGMISRVTEDFQTNLHSLIFADVWKKTKAKPVGINFGGDLLVKAEPSSEIWTGVFEVYVKAPSS
ncbi:MAG: hypothetical protein DRO87_04535 [Candidatus Thorarchaeota archaeon]|nr:MAG: hypothetical protein DRP09_00075 [Candidatus Thorarchaeota archaeon]RLI58870.1 MAG: hypothetical protein DRO87_04535 [Candidatus Thorarchaeota archaeon]